MSGDKPIRFESSVLEHRKLSTDGYELTLDRGDLTFDAGRLLTIHGRSVVEDRSYTIASGERDPFLQVLYRFMPGGKLTPQLTTLKAGDKIDISGPYGQFVVRDKSRPMVFVATGTGIAPCRSYIRSHRDLKISLIHGTRNEEDLFYRDEFKDTDYHFCLSREDTHRGTRRVTEVIENRHIADDEDFYLCGAFEMIFDVSNLLRQKGVTDNRIFTEEYYYRFES